MATADANATAATTAATATTDATAVAVRRAAAAFVAGAAGTVVSGAVVQFAVLPSTDISVDRWSYPWSSGALVPVSIFYALLHILIAVGLVGFARSGATGRSRTGRIGAKLAVAGTLLLVLGELASIPIRDAAMDDAAAGLVGGTFGLGTLVSAVGFLLAGAATLTAGVWHGWRRFTPLVTGVWTAVLVAVAATTALTAGVTIYGACLLAMAVALYTRPAPAGAGRRPADR